MRVRAIAAALSALVICAAGCANGPSGDGAGPETTAVAASGPAAAHAAPAGADRGRAPVTADAPGDAARGRAPVTADAPGDAARGRALVAELQCNRCHDGTGHAAAKRDAHCVHCHQDIAANRFPAPAAAMARWQQNLVQLRDVPSLAAAGARLRPAWIERFLLAPYDLRPRLHATMPRLAITPQQARDIAAHLTRDRDPLRHPADALDGADREAGRALFEAKGCGTCHAFGGTSGLAAPPPLKALEPETRTALALAPDLRFARERFEPADLEAWLLDPQAVKPDTPMPRVPLTRVEARDLAAFLLEAPLSAPEPRRMPERLPVLSRRVSYEEVNRRVFRNTCRHCHAEPDYALGDGGPGNTGGFGFKARGLNLATYEGIAAGILDEHGDRRSVFAPLPDGRPGLLAALLARQAEEADAPGGMGPDSAAAEPLNPAVRGMPLGLPALGPEEIQLVESWIAQGRPQ